MWFSTFVLLDNSSLQTFHVSIWISSMSLVTIFFFFSSSFLLDLSKIGSVLLSASVKRVGVSRMQDFINHFWRRKKTQCIFFFFLLSVFAHLCGILLCICMVGLYQGANTIFWGIRALWPHMGPAIHTFFMIFFTFRCPQRVVYLPLFKANILQGLLTQV